MLRTALLADGISELFIHGFKTNLCLVFSYINRSDVLVIKIFSRNWLHILATWYLLLWV